MAQIYDYAIIGSGLSGLSIATAISQHTNNVILIEGNESYGGVNRPIEFPTGKINNGLRFIPNTPSAKKALGFLENILGLKIIKNTKDSTPCTFENGQLIPFVGFGNNPPDFYEEINYFAQSSEIEIHIEPYEWPQLLFAKYKGEFLPRANVTKINVADDVVQSITINGAKTIQAKNFVFCGNIKELSLLLPESALSPKARAKLKKNLYWTAICLDICHAQMVSENMEIHILNGTTQDEIGPCAGRFLNPVETNGEILQASQWITFMDFEATDDTEAIVHALKKIKRQIKRPYQNSLDNIKSERILVAPIVSGHGDLKLNANQSLPSLNNFWIGSATANPQRNVVGALLQAQLICSALGMCQEAEKFETIESEI